VGKGVAEGEGMLMWVRAYSREYMVLRSIYVSECVQMFV